MPFPFSPKTLRRSRVLKEGREGNGPVIYWMSREQRSEDNWPLLAAAEAAAALQRSLICAFCLAPSFSTAQKRHYDFLIRGLHEAKQRLEEQGVKMALLFGEPGKEIAFLAEALDSVMIVTDFDPLPEKRSWKMELCDRTHSPVYEVDGHNIVPAWIASSKREYSAATFRRKITPMLPSYIEDFPALPSFKPWNDSYSTSFSLREAASRISTGSAGAPIDMIQPGEKQAKSALSNFLCCKLPEYDTRRNDPAADGVSGLSPWLHFGHIAPQRVVLEVMKEAESPARAAFLEELTTRRELPIIFAFMSRPPGSFTDSLNGGERHSLNMRTINGR